MGTRVLGISEGEKENLGYSALIKIHRKWNHNESSAMNKFPSVENKLQ
jgi:hypothetical protein